MRPLLTLFSDCSAGCSPWKCCDSGDQITTSGWLDVRSPQVIGLDGGHTQTLPIVPTHYGYAYKTLGSWSPGLYRSCWVDQFPGAWQFATGGWADTTGFSFLTSDAIDSFVGIYISSSSYTVGQIVLRFNYPGPGGGPVYTFCRCIQPHSVGVDPITDSTHWVPDSRAAYFDNDSYPDQASALAWGGKGGGINFCHGMSAPNYKGQLVLFWADDPIEDNANGTGPYGNGVFSLTNNSGNGNGSIPKPIIFGELGGGPSNYTLKATVVIPYLRFVGSTIKLNINSQTVMITNLPILISITQCYTELTIPIATLAPLALSDLRIDVQDACGNSLWYPVGLVAYGTDVLDLVGGYFGVTSQQSQSIIAKVAASLFSVLSKPQDAGLGDTIARIINPLGGAAFKRWYRQRFKTPCGCNRRQLRLNYMFPLRA